jgi:magnesium transporter
MVTITSYQNNELRKLTIKELAVHLQQQEGGVLWVDLEDPTEAEEETVLLSLFDFHPLAIEDCQHGREDEGPLPKVEDFGEYLFVVFNPMEVTSSPDAMSRGHELAIRTSQLSAFLSKRVLVTHHYKPLRATARAAAMCGKNAHLLKRGPDYVFHLIIDDIVDGYTPLMDGLDTVIEGIEDEVFEQPNQDTMFRILELKKTIMTIRRVALYQREMLNRLSRGEFSLINRQEVAYYRNVYDHLVRMADMADSYRDMVSGLLDGYLSVTSNRLNRVMKVLTIISTIFLPLSFITGFFGMNFVHLPGSGWVWGVAAVTLFMTAVAGGMLLWFGKNGWLKGQ